MFKIFLSEQKDAVSLELTVTDTNMPSASDSQHSFTLPQKLIKDSYTHPCHPQFVWCHHSLAVWCYL